jgi:type IV secretion system protein VirB9
VKILKTLLLLAPLGLAACAETPPPNYDPKSFTAAQAQPDPIAPPQNLVVPKGKRIKTATLLVEPKIQPASPTARVEAANKAALHEPTTDGYLNAVQIYPFSEDALYQLFAAPQQVSDIALQPGESLMAISAGDTVRWAVGDSSSGTGPAKQVHVLVKPFQAGLTTNLVILTDRRTYHLQLQSTQKTAMAALSFSYGEDGLVTGRRGAGSPIIDTGISLGNLRFSYKISGDSPSWRPLRAFDDGAKVYIEFPKRIDQGEAPPLFVVGAGGKSDLVNYRMRANYYIVDRLFAAAELRLGEKRQDVVRITRTKTQGDDGDLAALGQD